MWASSKHGEGVYVSSSSLWEGKGLGFWVGPRSSQRMEQVGGYALT
jgi:hypothetical protein